MAVKIKRQRLQLPLKLEAKIKVLSSNLVLYITVRQKCKKNPHDYILHKFDKKTIKKDYLSGFSC